MIPAAGLGTRLYPLTLSVPKALVEIEGQPVLSLQIETLKKAGIRKVIVNTYHFSEKIIEYLENNDFGVEVCISNESNSLLDTGGGLVKAIDTFNPEMETLLVHNVDILSNADIKGLYEYFQKDDCDALLLCSERESTRKLVFDKDFILKGWMDLKNEKKIPENLKVEKDDIVRSFSGIYIFGKKCQEEIKELMSEVKFPIMDYFLNFKRVTKIKGYEQKNLRLLDIGKPASLKQASEFLHSLR